MKSHKRVVILSVCSILMTCLSIFSQSISSSWSAWDALPRCTTASYWKSYDVRNDLNISNVVDISTRRSYFIDYVWCGKGFPSQQPASVTPNAPVPLANGSVLFDTSYMTNAGKIDLIRIEMDNATYVSKAYALFPKVSNNRLIICHSGHGSSFRGNPHWDAMTDSLNKAGFTIVYMWMPGYLPNEGPTVGDADLMCHINLKNFERSDFRPLSLFYEPVIVVLNYFDKNYKYTDYNIIGKSGGGYTTDIVSGIDPRFSNSISVAGSFPIHLQKNSDAEPCKGPNSPKDYEQGNSPDAYSSAGVRYLFTDVTTYPDLYLMASVGNHRKHMQIHNYYDNSCFWGSGSLTYRDTLRARATSINQSRGFSSAGFSHYLNTIEHDDGKKNHRIPLHCIPWIMDTLRGNVGSTRETFFKGIDLGGASGCSITLDGGVWLGNAYAEGCTVTGTAGATTNCAEFSATLTPPMSNSNFKKMMNNKVMSIAGSSFGINQTVVNGSYNVYLYVLEDSVSNARKATLKLEGVSKGDFGTLPLNAWKKYGPYQTDVTDGVLNIAFERVTGNPAVQGILLTRNEEFHATEIHANMRGQSLAPTYCDHPNAGTLTVYDIRGKRVFTHQQFLYVPGKASSYWAARKGQLSRGVYLYRVTVPAER